MEELTLQEYYELIGAEGLLHKSGNIDALTMDAIGSVADPELDCVTLQISTVDPDRLNDVLDPHGCIVDNFKLNPLFMFEHGKGPNGFWTNPDNVIGQVKSITMMDTGITAEARYVPTKSNPLPAQLWELEKKGLLPGNSIGWRPVSGITIDRSTGIRTVKKWELLDVSKVIIPVNGKASNKRL